MLAVTRKVITARFLVGRRMRPVSMFVSQICMIGELFTIGQCVGRHGVVLMLPVILPISPQTH